MCIRDSRYSIPSFCFCDVKRHVRRTRRHLYPSLSHYSRYQVGGIIREQPPSEKKEDGASFFPHIKVAHDGTHEVVVLSRKWERANPFLASSNSILKFRGRERAREQEAI